MEIISYYTSGRQEHWLGELKKCDWRAGEYLCRLLAEGTFFDTVGEGSELLLLTEGDELISFCTLAEKDEIQLTDFTPWIGFVYTFPEHRGKRCAGLLFDYAQRLAAEQGKDRIYLSTDHIGLYEKYGFEYLADMESIYGGTSRVYVRKAGQRYG
ncbi:MAG: GNAT family N-acetyltransferase [Ruminococcus sp.]|nr:GNAT family N-acetyltransferase [Ruminococcus sp.]